MESPTEEMQNAGEATEDDADYGDNKVDDEVDDDDDNAGYGTEQDSDEAMLEVQDYNLDEDHDTMSQDDAEHSSNTADEQFDEILDVDRNRVIPAIANAVMRENDEFLTDIRLAHTSTWPVRKEVRERRYRDGLDLLRGLPTIEGMNS